MTPQLQQMNSQHDLTPWTPTPVSLPGDWLNLFSTLANEEKSTSGIYIYELRCDTEQVGNLLHSWGLPWYVVMAGYLSGYDESHIRDTNLPDTVLVLEQMKDAADYMRYIDNDNLSVLLNPPYKNVGALLTAVAVYYQTLRQLQQRSNNEPYIGSRLDAIKMYSRTLLHIGKRLGMWDFKRGVEDLAEQLINPLAFAEKMQRYEQLLTQDRGKLEAACRFITTFYQQITSGSIMVTYAPCGVVGMERRQQDAHTTATTVKNQLTGFDLVTFDVIVPTMRECYTAFGVISQLGYVQDRVTDQLAHPKINGYSYLALGLLPQPRRWDIENTHFKNIDTGTWQIEIATPLMQAVGNFGCIHPRCYALYTQTPRQEEVNELPIASFWASEAGHIFTTIREELENNHARLDAESPIVVYDKQRTPVALPRGATALDFAFAVDRERGEYAIEAFINNRKAPLHRELHAGDVVEIRMSKETQVQEYWLDENYATTRVAREQIKKVLELAPYRRGYQFLNQELNAHGYTLSYESIWKTLQSLLKKYGLGNVDTYLERLEKTGNPPYTPEWAVQHIIQQMDERKETLSTTMSWAPVLEAVPIANKKFPYRRLFCISCQPSYPRDMKIVGLLRERSGDIVVHKENCSHLADHGTGQRVLLQPLTWQPHPTFRASFSLVNQDRKGLILDLTRQLRRYPCDLVAINAEATREGIAYIHFTLETYTESETVYIWQELSKIEDFKTVSLDPAKTLSDIYDRLQKLYQQDPILPERSPSEVLWAEQLAKLQPRNAILKNPFDISRPASGKMFFGRSVETRTMQRELCDGENGKALILYGPRRSGKSSICKNFLEQQVQPPFWHVLFSLQNYIYHAEEQILARLAEEVCQQFHEQLGCAAPDWSNFADSDPQVRFQRLLQSCLAEVPGARLVLALDEFGGALQSYEQHVLDYRFFSYWKELMNEVPQLSLILALPTSSHNRLISEDFSHVFSFAEYLPVLFLDKESAQHLLTNPLWDLQIAVHPDTVAWATRLTGDNPYYMTLIGQQLIYRLNQEPKKQQVLDDDLEFVVEQIIEAGANQNFAFHTRELQNSLEFRILEGMIELTEQRKQFIPLKRIATYLELPVNVTRQHLERLRNGLILEEHYQQEKPGNPHYSFRIELVRRWLARNRWFFASKNI